MGTTQISSFFTKHGAFVCSWVIRGVVPARFSFVYSCNLLSVTRGDVPAHGAFVWLCTFPSTYFP